MAEGVPGLGMEGAVTPRLATDADMPAMLDVFMRAFADDPHTQLQIAWRSADVVREGMRWALAGWLAAPDSTLLVVEEAGTGAVVGWACWAEVSPAIVQDQAPSAAGPVAASPIEALERLTGDEIRRCQQDVLARFGAVDVLVSIVVDPAHQGRGVGSALIGWGTAQADRWDRACWVHASEVGSLAFARHGFVPDRDLAIDLAPYAPPGNRRAWGTVRFVSMIRPAKVS